MSSIKDYPCPVATPVLKTDTGRVRGYYYDGVNVFKGIRYGTAKRFQSPEKYDGGDEIQQAFRYGYVPPLLNPNSIDNNFFVPHVFWTENEDCLNLNIWTPTLDSQAKLPVVVSLFGGGFGAGSAIEMVAYEGDGLAKNNDVVVVALNQRINMFGFFDLSLLGGYENSGCVGMEDAILGLQWVKDNISLFGGDPDNVTLYGTEGGGSRVKYALQIPAMAGLFQKAVNISGVAEAPNTPTAESCAALARAMLKKGDAAQQGIQYLENLPTRKLIALFKDTVEEDPSVTVRWRPIANGWYKGVATEVGVCREMKNIPVICGNTFTENSLTLDEQYNGRVSKEGFEAAARAKFADASEQVIELFRQSYPEKDVRDVLYFNSRHRCAVLDYAKVLSDSGVKTYVYLFAPTLGFAGGLPAYHCSDVPYLMHNVGKVPVAASPGVAVKVEEEYSRAFTTFASKGDPNFDGLAFWPEFTAQNQATMVFCEQTKARVDYDADFARLYRNSIHDPRG